MTTFTGEQTPTNTPPVADTTNQPPVNQQSNTAPTFNADELAKLNKRLQDKDAFIETLKQERLQDRALLDNMAQKLETLLAAQEVLATKSNQPPAANTSISADDLRKQGFLTVEDLQRAEQEKIQKQNLKSVIEIGRKQFGEKLDEVVAKKCQELGVSVQWAQAQAASNPNVFLNLFGLKTESSEAAAPTSGDYRTTINPATEPAPKKSVMHGATSKDVLVAWRSAGEAIKKN